MTLPYTQRYEDMSQVLQTLVDGKQADMWTALPGIIQSFDPVAVTCTVQPSVQSLYTGGNGQQAYINLPILPDVPVVFPRGGQYTITFPVQAGDECLVVFSSRSIDNWWHAGGVQPQSELRMHDLSDGFAVVGPFSQVNKIQNISTTTMQVRTNDGTIYTEIDAPNKISRIVNNGQSLVIDGNANKITATTTTFVIDGELQVTGEITAGNGGADSVTLQQHKHSGGPVPDPGT